MSAAFTHMKQIGAGCGGTVKLARRKADNKLYALKELELPRDPQEAAAVLQETHILAHAQQFPKGFSHRRNPVAHLSAHR